MKKKLIVMAAALLILLSIGMTVSAADNKTGWYQKDGAWWYVQDGDYEYTGWVKDNGSWYYIKNGRMHYNRIDEIDGDWYDFEPSGRMKTNAWVEYHYQDEYKDFFSWIYFGADGREVFGWKKIGGYWYYFDEEYDGAAANDGFRAVKEKGKYVFYYFDPQARMCTNKWVPYEYTHSDPKDPDNTWSMDSWFYYGSDGREASGWKKIDGYWYYFDPTEDNIMLIDDIWWVEEDQSWYWFDEKGHMLSNKWLDCTWVDNGGYMHYEWYYYGADGREASGWKQIGAYWYYFEPNNYNIMKCDTMTTIKGVKYCFDKKGHMLSNNWYSIDNTSGTGPDKYWYYFNADGSAASGWKYIGSTWYYFAPSSNAMVFDCTLEINGKNYTFDKNGKWVK